MILIYKPCHNVPLIVRDVLWGVIRGGSFISGAPSLWSSFPGYRIRRHGHEQGLRVMVRIKM